MPAAVLALQRSAGNSAVARLLQRQFDDQGRTGEGLWHHCGGTGGKGNENTGQADLVAPKYVSAPAAKGGNARAWLEDGTGKVEVKRSYNGVPVGAQGAFVAPPPGTVWMTKGAAKRVDKHEEAHGKKTKELHDQHIKPLEKRVTTWRRPTSTPTTAP